MMKKPQMQMNHQFPLYPKYFCVDISKTLHTHEEISVTDEKKSSHLKYVYYVKDKNRWQVRPFHKGKWEYVGTFHSEIDAINARDAFLRDEEVINPASNRSIHGKYIYYNYKRKKQFLVKISIDNQSQYIGTFLNKKDAIIARNSFLKKRIDEYGQIKKWDRKDNSRHGKYIYYRDTDTGIGTGNDIKNVKQRNPWAVQVKRDNIQHFVGSFSTHEDAVAARDAFLNTNANINDDAQDTNPLSLLITSSTKKRSTSPYGKHIYYKEKTKNFRVIISKATGNSNRKSLNKTFPTHDDAVIARDTFLNEVANK